MKVVILAGGLGTRLREETEFRPKPMVEIGNRPILWHIMKIYAHYGYKDFVVCLGYKGEVIKEYFLDYEAMNNDFTVRLGNPNEIEFHSNHGEDGWRVTLADTGDDAMTGARIKRVEKYIDGEEFMVTYGDGVADIDINKLLAFHRSHGHIATLTGVRPTSRFGELLIKENVVSEFSEKPQSSEGHINGGFFIFKKEFFDYLENDDGCILERTPMKRLAEAGELMVYPHDGFWQCMDTYRDNKYLQEIWQKGDAPWKVWA